MQLLTVLVTVLVMVNATSAATLDRSGELATWHALGLERSRVVRFLAAEAGVLGLVASFIGMCAGCLMGMVLVRVVAPAIAGFRMGVRWPVETVTMLVGLTPAAAMLAATLVARSGIGRMMRS